MLWILKRSVSMRRFFWAPKTYVKTDGYENIYNYMLKKFCLSKLDQPMWLWYFITKNAASQVTNRSSHESLSFAQSLHLLP